MLISTLFWIILRGAHDGTPEKPPKGGGEGRQDLFSSKCRRTSTQTGGSKTEIATEKAHEEQMQIPTEQVLHSRRGVYVRVRKWDGGYGYWGC